MSGLRIWCLQLAVVLPDGASPEDLPSLARLEDAIRSMVTETDRVRIDTFTVHPGGVRSSLADTIDFHRLEPDGSCRCGWSPGEAGGGSQAEHVAEIFEVSTRAHASM